MSRRAMKMHLHRYGDRTMCGRPADERYAVGDATWPRDWNHCRTCLRMGEGDDDRLVAVERAERQADDDAAPGRAGETTR